MTTAHYVNIGSLTDPETGEVTLFLPGESWGPIVTGKTLSEAKQKFEKAFIAACIARTFVVREYGSANEKGDEIRDIKGMMENLKNTLQTALV